MIRKKILFFFYRIQTKLSYTIKAAAEKITTSVRERYKKIALKIKKEILKIKGKLQKKYEEYRQIQVERKKNKEVLKKEQEKNVIVRENEEFNQCEKEIQEQEVGRMDIQQQHYNFCTISSIQYGMKVIALYESLRAYTAHYTLYICCIDEFLYDFLKALHLEHAILINLSTIETRELLEIKESRSTSEYCWTLKPWIMSHLLIKYSLEAIVYCDSDMFFYADGGLVYKDWGEASVYLCMQRDLDWVQRKYGFYQAGLVGFKNNPIGIKAVTWWKEKCLEWCYHKEDLEHQRWGDQKYLDDIPRLFGDVKISGHLGINAAPWNIIYNNNFQINEMQNRVFIEEDPLVIFHFACIDIYDQNNFDLWNLNTIEIQQNIKRSIYLPYLLELRKIFAVAKSVLGKNVERCLSGKNIRQVQTPFRYDKLEIEMWKWNEVYYFCSIASKEYLYKIITLYQSIRNQMENFHMWVCCMDEKTQMILDSLKMTNMTIIPLSQIETKEIKMIKADRKLNEFCWTIKSVLCKYLLKNHNIKKILYCDADLYFFKSPETIFKEWEGYSIFITRQRASRDMEKTNGGFQAGLLGFSNDESSMNVLNWWEKNCMQWCYDTPDIVQERWGDQKYLDQIPQLFSSIKISTNEGVNLGPWNVIINDEKQYDIEIIQENVYINEEQVIVYHFGSTLIFNKNEFDLWKLDPLNIDYRVLNYIYLPYLNRLKETMELVEGLSLGTQGLFSEKPAKIMNYISV